MVTPPNAFTAQLPADPSSKFPVSTTEITRGPYA